MENVPVWIPCGNINSVPSTAPRIEYVYKIVLQLMSDFMSMPL